VRDTPSSSRRVLFLCNDVVGKNMAGSGIRYWELARVLSHYRGSSPVASFDVTFAVLPFLPDPILPDPIPFPAHIQRCHGTADVRALAAETDVIVTQGILLGTYPFLADLGIPLAFDFYIPFLLERLHVDTDTSAAQHLFMHEGYRRALGQQLVQADFIFCASEKQRDYWLGALSAAGRVNPYAHADDPTLRKLIDVVSFGLPAQAPCHTRQVLKGIYPGIGPNDRVLLWGGGIWDWLDASTLIRAMARIAGQRTDVKLFFMGIKHPSPLSPKMEAAAEALALSKSLGLTDHVVFFNEWTPYAERENYLLEADLGISLHLDHLETRLSFRTRYLDYLWAALPIVATRGDVLSELVESQRLGRVVAPGDVDGLVEAILSLLDQPNLRETLRPRFEQVAAAFRWEVVAQPLIEFCIAPRLAPDKEYLRGRPVLELNPTPWWGLPGKVWRALRRGGVRRLVRQVDEYRRWLSNR
jgi:glycosyltransferase involved in cell wall biosynthesis